MLEETGCWVWGLLPEFYPRNSLPSICATGGLAWSKWGEGCDDDDNASCHVSMIGLMGWSKAFHALVPGGRVWSNRCVSRRQPGPCPDPTPTNIVFVFAPSIRRQDPQWL